MMLPCARKQVHSSAGVWVYHPVAEEGTVANSALTNIGIELSNRHRRSKNKKKKRDQAKGDLDAALLCFH